jgi:hypothetical protein
MGNIRFSKYPGLRSPCNYFKEKDFTTDVTPLNDTDDMLHAVTSMGR